MKRTLCLLLFFYSLGLSAQPVEALRHIIDSSIARMEQYSLHKKEINWKAFRQEVYAQTKGIDNLDTLLNQFPLFFKWINDFHGAISVPGKWISWSEGNPKKKRNAMLDSALKKGTFLYVERWNDIGYFRVPGGSTKNVAKVTQMLVDSLCKIHPSTVKGWIIDLRLNTGGNIWFMLPPLATLIGDGIIGGLKYMDGSPDVITYIKDGKPFGNNQFYDIPNKTCELPNDKVPVVILAGPATASSGEGVLLAFKGRPATIIFGEQTAGLITSNNSFDLGSNVTLNLATSYMKDRTGKFYTEGIKPDVIIKGGDNFYNLHKDIKVQQGIKWLQKEIKKQK